MTLRFDHAVIAVNDLQQAMADYRELGFNPFYGGEHVGGKTHNALIVFQDGTYLELLAPTSLALLDSLDPNDRSNFLHLFQAGEGLVAFALYSDNLEADVAAMQARKVAVTLRPPTGRARPDGQQLQWRSAMLDNGSMNPFFIQDITPRSLRVPDDPAMTTQPNGAVGVATIKFEDTFGSMRSYKEKYDAILGYEAIIRSDNFLIDASEKFYRIGQHCHLEFIEYQLAIRIPPNFIDRPTKIGLWTNEARANYKELDKNLSHNAEIRLHGSK